MATTVKALDARVPEIHQAVASKPTGGSIDGATSRNAQTLRSYFYNLVSNQGSGKSLEEIEGHFSVISYIEFILLTLIRAE